MATKEEVFEKVLREYIFAMSSERNGYCVKQDGEECLGNCNMHHKKFFNDIYRELQQEYKDAK